MKSKQLFDKSSIHLWQLISPTLPIGAYSYSQGLEYAVEKCWIEDEKSTNDWVIGQIKNNLSALDAPIFLRMYDAWKNKDIDTIEYLNDLILALRESSELKQEDCSLGAACKKVLKGLNVEIPELGSDNVAFVTVFSFASVYWSIDKLEAVHGLLWSWCENQVSAAIKIVPLGQTSGQRIMHEAIDAIVQSIENAQMCNDDDIGLLAPGVAIASALHETQYTRLFRS